MTFPVRNRACVRWLQWLSALTVASGMPLRGAPPAFQPPVEVEVPALIITESKAWLWASFDGFEIVSLSSEEVTRTFAQNIAQQRANLDAILPAALRITWARPMRVVLYGVENFRPLPPVIGPILSQKLSEKAREQALANREPKPLDVIAEPRITPGAWVADADGIVVFNLVQQKLRSEDLSALPAPAFVSFLMDARVPPLPVWLMEGFFDVYSRATVTGSELDLPPFVWVSHAQSQLMLKDRTTVPGLLPLAELFAHMNEATAATDPGRRQHIRAQTALFVRWAFEYKSAGGAAALWKFAQGATTGPEGEARFKDCFGLTQEAALDALKAFLPAALKKPARIRLEKETRLPAIEIRPATADEVARVKGDWERLAGRLVSPEHPELRPIYDEGARRTLLAGSDNASADPELLAVRALFAVDTGNSDSALPLLETLAASPSPRPRVMVELARIRLEQARAALAPGAKLDDATVASISALVRPVLESRPPMPRAFQVLAEMWGVAATPPSEADVALLARAVQTMPDDAALVVATARLMLDLGQVDKAHDAVEAGLVHVTDAGGRRRLYAIRSAVRAATKK